MVQKKKLPSFDETLDGICDTIKQIDTLLNKYLLTNDPDPVIPMYAIAGLIIRETNQNPNVVKKIIRAYLRRRDDLYITKGRRGGVRRYRPGHQLSLKM